MPQRRNAQDLQRLMVRAIRGERASRTPSKVQVASVVLIAAACLLVGIVTGSGDANESIDAARRIVAMRDAPSLSDEGAGWLRTQLLAPSTRTQRLALAALSLHGRRVPTAILEAMLDRPAAAETIDLPEEVAGGDTGPLVRAVKREKTIRACLAVMQLNAKNHGDYASRRRMEALLMFPDDQVRVLVMAVLTEDDEYTFSSTLRETIMGDSEAVQVAARQILDR